MKGIGAPPLNSVECGEVEAGRRLTTILRAMPLAEAIEITRIHRVAGLTGDCTAWVMSRPFRAPHHTISDAGLIGGACADAGRCVAGLPWRALPG